jgi:hypothetical protein
VQISRIPRLPGVVRLRARVAAIFADMPVLFFAVVIGVALTFRVAIDWARTATLGPEPAAPELVTSSTSPAKAVPATTTAAAAAAPTQTIAVAPEPGIGAPPRSPFAKPARPRIDRRRRFPR